MDEERLAEIEVRIAECWHQQDDGGFRDCLCFDDYQRDSRVLIVEVRRLRRALQLSEASRGVLVGRD